MWARAELRICGRRFDSSRGHSTKWKPHGWADVCDECPITGQASQTAEQGRPVVLERRFDGRRGTSNDSTPARAGRRGAGDDVARRRAEHLSGQDRPAGRLPAGRHHDEGRAVLRRLDPDGCRLPRQPSHGRGRTPRPAPDGPGRDRHEGRSGTALRGRRQHGQRVRLRRENRCARPHLRALDRRQLHQRRRRDQEGCVVHRLVEAGPVSRTPGPRGATWSGQGLQHREPHG